MRKNKRSKYFLCLTVLAFVLVVSGCSSRNQKESEQKSNDAASLSQNTLQDTPPAPQSNVINKEYLDSYKPQKTDYNFYFT